MADESFLDRRDRYIRLHHREVFGTDLPDGPVSLVSTNAGVVQNATFSAIGEMLEEVLRRLS